jgi:putative tryptophan/tyrosine transport system substrate-binding protein
VIGRGPRHGLRYLLSANVGRWEKDGLMFCRRRRELILALGSAAAWPVMARAQQSEHMRRIAMLWGYTEDDPEMKRRLTGFRERLEGLGWFEGQNIRIDFRFAPAGAEQQAEKSAKELVALNPDVIVAHSTLIARALQRQTATIPIVFVSVGDPIGAGLVASWARPGANLTGPLTIEPSIIGKWFEMLKEIDPHLERIALLDNRKTTPYDYVLRQASILASSLSIELIHSSVENAADIERSIDSFAKKANGGLVLPPDLTISVHRNIIISLAARYRLPAVYFAGFFVEAGGLMSYGINYDAHFRQAAGYVDRILRGVKPAELPVQAPTKFEMFLNKKTARAAGLAIPEALLVAADAVIQ